MSVYNNITFLSNTTLPSSTDYFLDANVWIYAMQDESLLNRYETPYFNFFYKIIDSQLFPQPRIILPTLLFSEIVNTYLTRVAIRDYKAQENIPDKTALDFKKDYRPTKHYRDSYKKICDDIMALRSSIIFINDDSVVKNPPGYLNWDVKEFDFNDFFYYQICKEYQKQNKITIITNDGDFRINDIPIITVNRDILNLRGQKVTNSIHL